MYSIEDIRNNNGGSYLANQKAWDPIVTATDSCGLSITCNPIAGVSSFMTVMFRSDGNPLYLNRVVSGQSKYLPQPRSIDNLTCAETENGTYQWYYYGSPLPDLSLSCIADEDSCQCPSIIINGFPTVSSRMRSDPNRCGYFNASCERPEGTYPFMFSDDTYAIITGTSSSVFQYDDLMCLKEEDGAFNWYYANLRMPNPSLSCASEVQIYGEVSYGLCEYFKSLNEAADFEWYHRQGNYENALFGESRWVHFYTLNELILGCADDEFDPIVFSENNDPILMTGDRNARTVRCIDHPLDSKVKIWIARGNRVINPAVACVKLEIQKDDVPMNGCQCPPIKHIDASGIIQMDSHTSWLARKPIIRASLVVDSNCEVSFNAALLGPMDFQLMLLRDEAPPIFMRRFSKDDIKPAKVALTDLTCRKVGNAYQWDYGSSKITDKTLYMTTQVNQDDCSCVDFNTGPGITMTKVNGSCDMLHFHCDNDQYGVKIEYKPIGGPDSVLVNHEIVRGFSNEMTLVEANCFNFDWRIHGEVVTGLTATCADVKQENTVYYNSFARSCPCNQPAIFESPKEEDQQEFWEEFSFLYPGSEKYKDRAPRNLQMRSLPNECRMEFTCQEDDTLVVFKMNSEPMVFPAGKKPDMRCVSPPIAQNLQTEKYWWIDNQMVAMPVFACFSRIAEVDDPEIDMNGCRCPQINYIDQEGIRSLGNQSSWLAGKETRKPKITVSAKCEIVIYKSGLNIQDHNIVLFRKEAPPLFMRRYSTSQPSSLRLNDLVCNEENHWEYEGGLVSKDPISLAVQLNTGSCSCEKLENTSNLTITENNGVCDDLQLECPTPGNWIMLPPMGILFSSPLRSANVICADGQWYSNGYPLDSPTVQCFDPTDVFKDFIEACRCTPVQIHNKTSYDYLSKELDKKNILADRIFDAGEGEHQISNCEFSYACPDDYEPVVFSIERDPRIFPLGETLSLKCVDPPFAQGQKTDKFWWSGDLMETFVQVTCVKKIE
ncbi:hypothetical protein B9Z55_002759 [Caenorhabditis nigoni]|uniref:Uncharacterized protein n=3 Tax=Caenorhabditis nigoni TaxID=1611254 RepID=A0A2G5VMI7_9PELO|nr:hypothetical protein B9Z55_002759 [Caenorhabditis nigoni]